MISLETVVRLAPDLIVDASEVEQSTGDGAERRLATERLWRQTTMAAQVARVRVATSEAFTVPGPRVVEAAEMLAAWLDEGEER
jgi:ABC-type hemin transport system substrate-binding protein